MSMEISAFLMTILHIVLEIFPYSTDSTNKFYG
jgi:hypothetical protein